MNDGFITTCTTSEQHFLLFLFCTVLASTSAGVFIGAMLVRAEPRKTTRPRHKRAERATRHLTVPAVSPTTDDTAAGYVPVLNPTPASEQEEEIFIRPFVPAKEEIPV